MRKNKKKKVSLKTKLLKKVNKAKLEEFKRKLKITKNVLCVIFGIIAIYWIGYIDGNIENNKANSNENKEQVETVEKEEKPVELAENELKVLYDSDVKTYMDYRAITNKNSEQYWYIHNSGLIEIKNGYLMNGEYYGVALGTYFGEIGSKYIFTLDTEKQIKVVKVEEKSDNHTIDGFIQKWDKSVIEFVIDTKSFKKSKNGYVNNGNFNTVERFNGKIVKIEKVEEGK